MIFKVIYGNDRNSLFNSWIRIEDPLCCSKYLLQHFSTQILLFIWKEIPRHIKSEHEKGFKRLDFATRAVKEDVASQSKRNGAIMMGKCEVIPYFSVFWL